MKIALPLALVLSFSALALAASGCSSKADTVENPTPAEEEVVAGGFSGAYEGVTDNEAFLFGEVEIIRRGPKLFARFDAAETPLTKIASGHYTFDTEDFGGDCDDPGCHFPVRAAGTVTMEKVGDVTRPMIKATVTELFPHPESEGDREGEHDTPGTWAKKL